MLSASCDTVQQGFAQVLVIVIVPWFPTVSTFTQSKPTIFTLPSTGVTLFIVVIAVEYYALRPS
jgi:hypothetical protein